MNVQQFKKNKNMNKYKKNRDVKKYNNNIKQLMIRVCVFQIFLKTFLNIYVNVYNQQSILKIQK